MENFVDLSLKDLTPEEQQNLNGGFIIKFIIGYVVAHILAEVLFNPQQHIDEFKKGYNECDCK